MGTATPDLAELLTANQVAELLGVSPKLLADWRYRGEGPQFVKLSHRVVRYHPRDVEQWIRRNTRKRTA